MPIDFPPIFFLVRDVLPTFSLLTSVFGRVQTVIVALLLWSTICSEFEADVSRPVPFSLFICGHGVFDLCVFSSGLVNVSSFHVMAGCRKFCFHC